MLFLRWSANPQSHNSQRHLNCGKSDSFRVFQSGLFIFGIFSLILIANDIN